MHTIITKFLLKTVLGSKTIDSSYGGTLKREGRSLKVLGTEKKFRLMESPFLLMNEGWG